ncbi:DUF2235 domain-containing protein, partial [Stenotrophomonas sp. MMGLT7]|uniref:T6SS phospholipase effector Tle1-like catalytic domain-containing protein n=1 Tax=Stenotrophomonas sp. MMGLT7 TaxID=2901227 RepID=UPI001E3D3A31
FYLPGLGTYFREIGDPGNTTTGKAFGAWGEERLKWAMQQLDLTLSQYPVRNIQEVRVALFGFSRGAALARAFARMLAERAQRAGAGWEWDSPKVPFRLYFMGLFDTVASVGLPATASTSLSLQIAQGWRSLEGGLRLRGDHLAMGPLALAFGEPGADPTPGNPDGHMDWASNLRIPELAEQCVHMVAAHEQRNSFPVDSVRERQSYPSGCVEILYPGMHSDVGGGYLPGFQSRSIGRAEALSNIPLLEMHKRAIQAQVPLEPVGQFHDPGLGASFQIAPDLVRRWKHYMALAGNGGKALGKGVLGHMRLYFAWRFQRIARLQQSEIPNAERVRNEADMRARERQYAARKAEAEREMNRLRDSPERQAAQDELRRAETRYQSVLRQTSRFGGMQGELTQAREEVDRAKDLAAEADDPYLRAQAEWVGIPGNSVDNMLVYDRQLMRDAQSLRREWSRRSGSAKLRPHYAVLLQAYEDEFVHQRGLRDEEIIAFFDSYVHDSMAGFGMDATLPSDPRCIYVGGDFEARYARVDTSMQVETQVA